jgi:hypothetical protein
MKTPRKRVIIPLRYRPSPPTVEYDIRAERAQVRLKAAIEIAEACFARLCREFGEPAARLAMKRCHDFAKAPPPDAPRPREPQDVKLPPVAEIETTMSDHQVRTWWRRIQDNRQVFEGGQKESLAALARRYRECGGYQRDIPPPPPPLKKKGARRRNTPKAAELPAMFEALKAKHPRFSNPRIAESIFKEHGAIYGKSVEAIERAERNWRKKNRKV